MSPQAKDPGWKIEEAVAALKARIDPYIWEQGQELYRRDAVEGFQQTADGGFQVQVLDPRDSRKFFVALQRDREGTVTVRCPCPYRLGGYCRHQVVSLEFFRAALNAARDSSKAAADPKREAKSGEARASREGTAPRAGREKQPQAETAVVAPEPAAPHESAIYRVGSAGAVKATPDGSLLRVTLLSLGSLTTPHRIGLQLYTGTGWTEVRTPDVARWIHRGDEGPHPRDAWLAARLAGTAELRREVSHDEFATLLHAAAGTEVLVDRTGRALRVSPWPWRLAARLTRGAGEGVAVELSCRSAEGKSVPFVEVALVPAVAPWIQLEDGSFHPLVSGAPGPILAELQEEDLSSLRGEDLDRLLARGVTELEKICPGAVETQDGLIEEVEGVTGARIRLDGSPKKLHGRLELRYGKEWMSAPETPEPWTVEREGTIHRFPPSAQSLARAHRELDAAGFRRQEDGSWLLERESALRDVLVPRPGAFLRFELPRSLDALNLVDRSPILRLSVGAGGAAPVARKPGVKSSGIPWLEVSAVLEDGGRELPLDLAQLASLRSGDAQGLTQLADGTVLALAHASVRSLLDLAAQGEALDDRGAAGGRGHRSFRLPLALVGELLTEEPSRQVEFDLRVASLVEGLRGGTSPESHPLAAEADAVLRPYQRDAVRWMGQLAAWGLGGLLADEMGLGKTVMTLSHFFGRPGAGAGPEAGPVLVVCPSSLVFNWLDECRRFFPSVRSEGLHGLSPEAREERIRTGADMLVTSYALLRRDREALEATSLRAVILDEAQHIKNSESQTAQAAFGLRAPERWVLTGTPVENHLGDLWSLFHFLEPGLLGARAEFQEAFAEPISRKEEEPLTRLRTRVAPFILRRTKAQVLTDLPPRIDQVERVPMTPVQRKLYESCLLAARGDVESADENAARFQILAALTRLRQICCHPRLILDADSAAELGAEAELTGGKFELLLELLEECVEEGHRVLLYSQFTSMLDLIEERLAALEIARCRLDGSTRDREGVVKRFARDSGIPIFLISLKAGGFGLNLTQADTVILYDPWWNPAAEEQAAARAHRMGQTLPVHVHRLITAGTVEEKILELQARKRDLAGRMLEGAESLEAISIDDLKSVLFA